MFQPPTSDFVTRSVLTECCGGNGSGFCFSGGEVTLWNHTQNTFWESRKQKHVHTCHRALCTGACIYTLLPCASHWIPQHKKKLELINFFYRINMSNVKGLLQHNPASIWESKIGKKAKSERGNVSPHGSDNVLYFLSRVKWAKFP